MDTRQMPARRCGWRSGWQRRSSPGTEATMRTELYSRAATVAIGPDQPFVMIGERINPTGRKKLGPLMAAGDFGAVGRDARLQVAAGAQVLDVNAGYPD